MECDFREPSLALYRMIHRSRDTGDVEKLVSHLLESNNMFVYKQLVDQGLLRENPEDLNRIEERLKDEIRSLESLKEKDSENESYVAGINKRIAEVYARSCDVANFESTFQMLTTADTSTSLKMDIHMCFIRIAIIIADRSLLLEHIEKATSIYENTCDWDRKNKFKVYLGLFNLMRTNFKQAANLFSESLTSFDGEELLSFDEVVFYLIFTSLLAYGRPEIKQRILDNSEVSRSNVSTQLVDSFYNCHYGRVLRDLLDFINTFTKDAFVGLFREHFCKEMKIKIYCQLLTSYKSLQLDKMAGAFLIHPHHLEEDLINFINEGRLNCTIDKITGVVHIASERKDFIPMHLALKTDVLLKKIKKMGN